MHASGLFFLRHTPHPCRVAADGTPSVLLPLCERDNTPGTGPHGAGLLRHVTALWSGPEACAWLQAHAGQLHAGTALHLQLHHLRAHGGEIVAQVQACALAPARWPAAPTPARPAAHNTSPSNAPQAHAPPTPSPHTKKTPTGQPVQPQAHCSNAPPPPVAHHPV